ncbi:hypothetical protein CDAR_299391 [Caerostris darwini]|uniref:Uncharacterized protein n=1 Tax=Caerostris darwini TaxID=1538125 RepID=A0AAV4RRQ5_9ARAC|nr:hypothetical protein CDAR_299391 [Caerostris darwini]
MGGGRIRSDDKSGLPISNSRKEIRSTCRPCNREIQITCLCHKRHKLQQDVNGSISSERCLNECYSCDGTTHSRLDARRLKTGSRYRLTTNRILITQLKSTLLISRERATALLRYKSLRDHRWLNFMVSCNSNVALREYSNHITLPLGQFSAVPVRVGSRHGIGLRGGDVPLAAAGGEGIESRNGGEGVGAEGVPPVDHSFGGEAEIPQAVQVFFDGARQGGMPGKEKKLQFGCK